MDLFNQEEHDEIMRTVNYYCDKHIKKKNVFLIIGVGLRRMVDLMDQLDKVTQETQSASEWLIESTRKLNCGGAGKIKKVHFLKQPEQYIDFDNQKRRYNRQDPYANFRNRKR